MYVIFALMIMSATVTIHNVFVTGDPQGSDVLCLAWTSAVVKFNRYKHTPFLNSSVTRPYYNMLFFVKIPCEIMGRVSSFTCFLVHTPRLSVGIQY